jgi:hypothetical protein
MEKVNQTKVRNSQSEYFGTPMLAAFNVLNGEKFRWQKIGKRFWSNCSRIQRSGLLNFSWLIDKLRRFLFVCFWTAS